MNKKDSLGDRMKENYENRTRFLLPRRSNVIIRIDGKAFHSYTRGMKRPIDEGLTEDMNLTAKYLCENIQGAKFGYVQSDEISIWLTDYDDLQTDAWFDYNLQKMCSISASLATAEFNRLRIVRQIRDTFEMIKEENLSTVPLLHDIAKKKIAAFDARVFVVPEMEEVINYFVWRQQDATRNSISMAAQSMFSHKELQGKSTNEMQELMFTIKGVNWNDYPEGFKRGRAIIKKEIVSDLSLKIELIREKKNLLCRQQNFEEAAKCRQLEKDWMQELENNKDAQVVRKKWDIVDPPIFTQKREFIGATIIEKKQ